jgi:hypothetical protein
MTYSTTHPILRIFAFGALLLALLFTPFRASAQSYPPAWSATATYSVGDQVQLNGNIYRAIKAVTTPNLTPSTFYTYWELYNVRSNTTLLIGADEPFANLQVAWNNILSAKISDGVYLHLYISTHHANLTETFSAPFSLDHNSGSRISILGDVQANITFSFPSSNGFVIDSGHSLGNITNVTLSGTTSNGGDNGVYGYLGLIAESGGSLPSISGLSVVGFATSVYARAGLITLSNPGGTMPFFGYSVAFFADQGGTILLTGLNLQGPGANTASTALYARLGGSISAVANNLSYFGIEVEAEDRGIIDVNYSTMGASGKCCLADLGGFIRCEDAALGAFAADNVDAQAFDGGEIDLTDSSYLTKSVGTNDGSYIWL